MARTLLSRAAQKTAHVRCHAVAVPSCGRTGRLLFLLAWALFESGSPNFGWDSSAAPPELQGSGTSAMQKSIYSHGVTGKEREGERETERHRQTKRQKDEGRRRGEG